MALLGHSLRSHSCSHIVFAAPGLPIEKCNSRITTAELCWWLSLVVLKVCSNAGCVAAFHVLNALEGLDHVWRWCRRSYDLFCFPPFFFPVFVSIARIGPTAGLCCGSFEPPACAVHDSRRKIPCSAAALSVRPAVAIQRPSWSDKVLVYLLVFCQVTANSGMQAGKAVPTY